jgi:uncharacterized protein (DUF433 family)
MVFDRTIRSREIMLTRQQGFVKAAFCVVARNRLSCEAGTVILLDMKYANRITVDPEQCGGRPCIRHYRIRVKDVLEMLAAGVSEGEILKDYDFLQPEDIRACLEYAAATR